MDQSTVSKLERGEKLPTREQAEVLADFYGVRVGWLLYGEGSPWGGATEGEREVAAFVAGRLAGMEELIELAQSRLDDLRDAPPPPPDDAADARSGDRPDPQAPPASP